MIYEIQLLKQFMFNNKDLEKIKNSDKKDVGLHFIGVCKIEDIGIDIQFKQTYYLAPNDTVLKICEVNRAKIDIQEL